MDGRLTPHTRLKEAARAGVPQRRRENRPPLSGRGSGEGQGRKARWVWAQRVLSAELGPAPALAPANICAPHEAHGPRPTGSPLQGGSGGRLQGTGLGTPHPGVWSAEARAPNRGWGPGGRGWHVAPPPTSSSSCREPKCHKLTLRAGLSSSSKQRPGRSAWARGRPTGARLCICTQHPTSATCTGQPRLVSLSLCAGRPPSLLSRSPSCSGEQARPRPGLQDSSSCAAGGRGAGGGERIQPAAA